MTRETAKEVSELMQAILAQLDQSVRRVQEKEPDADFQRYRRAVGKVLGAVVLDIMNPLYAEHPDLKPPQLK